ncbi:MULTISPECIES: hypothetical protein [unclassified Nonomuraea]|uniref:hypothetical protein n=1 Tax=unclassified Nonomuraea TaxID=2593643 RepID=UPI0033E09EEB
MRVDSYGACQRDDSTLMMHGDSAFCAAETVATCREHGARFATTAELDPKLKAAIAAMPPCATTSAGYRCRSSARPAPDPLPMNKPRPEHGGSPAPRN